VTLQPTTATCDATNQYNIYPHLPTDMPGVIVPMLVPDQEYCRADWSNDVWSCMRLSKLMSAGVSSGSGASPSRYCMTCLVVGLPLEWRSPPPRPARPHRRLRHRARHRRVWLLAGRPTTSFSTPPHGHTAGSGL
jgi:hypothetical protein